MPLTVQYVAESWHQAESNNKVENDAAAICSTELVVIVLLLMVIVTAINEIRNNQAELKGTNGSGVPFLLRQ